METANEAVETAKKLFDKTMRHPMRDFDPRPLNEYRTLEKQLAGHVDRLMDRYRMGEMSASEFICAIALIAAD